MIFGLGIIAGILLCIFVAILNIRFAQPIERAVKQIEASVKPKGRLIDPEEDLVKGWLNELPHDNTSKE